VNTIRLEKRWAWFRWLLVFAVVLLMLAPMANAQATRELEGWASVPGGTVWLRPGIDSYEHSTGLVRDMRTGQKHYAVTPQQASQVYVVQPPYVQSSCGPCVNQMNNCGPCNAQGATVAPRVAPVTVVPQRPYAPQYLPNPYYAPFAPSTRPRANSSRYDYGPYGAVPGTDYGFQPQGSRSLKSEFGTLRGF
jgi:hypothetical protein